MREEAGWRGPAFLFPGLAHWRDPTLAARAPAAEIEFSLPRAEEPPPLNFGQ